jgi:hypothetical protein
MLETLSKKIPRKTGARSAQDKAKTAQDSRECNCDDTLRIKSGPAPKCKIHRIHAGRGIFRRERSRNDESVDRQIET